MSEQARHHELPKSGGWVALIDPGDGITERQRRPVVKAMQRISVEGRKYLAVVNGASPDEAEGSLSDADLELLYDVNDHMAAAVVASASFLQPGERCTIEHIRDLKAADYDLVAKEAAQYLELFIEVDFETRDPERANPTSPSPE